MPLKTAEIRSDILRKIESLNAHQLKDVYGLFQNYLNGKEDTEEWDALPRQQKEKIKQSLKQADTNLIKPADEVTARLRGKFGLNG